ncbi:MAG: N-formylglutamate amidohydrolase [Sphingomonadales bacterium]|jgi:predicted N-formylglutamate amidohydrolase
MDQPFEINGPLESHILLIADHASSEIPQDYDQLGLEPAWITNHIAYDIGTKDLCISLQKAFEARAVMAGFSRLLVDPNRPLDHETLIPQLSDNIFIPGNADISEEERGKRIAKFHTPYHEAIAAEVARIQAGGQKPIIVSIHSFTPIMNGQQRPWHAAVLWNHYDKLAHAVADALEARGDVVVGRNVPYSGKILNYTMDRHAEAHDIPYVTLEIRQDLIADKQGVAEWTEILREILLPILAASAQ